MPIYEYRCSSCGFQKEYLQKVADPVMTVCPECNKQTFSKMLTAAGFQLKGSGWYATDFRNSGAKPAAKVEDASKVAGKDAAKTDGKETASAKETAKADDKAVAKAESKAESKADATSPGTRASPANS